MGSFPSSFTFIIASILLMLPLSATESLYFQSHDWLAVCDNTDSSTFNFITTELFNPHTNVYAIASSGVINHSGFWHSAGIKPRMFKNVNDLMLTNKKP